MPVDVRGGSLKPLGKRSVCPWTFVDVRGWLWGLAHLMAHLMAPLRPTAGPAWLPGMRPSIMPISPGSTSSTLTSPERTFPTPTSHGRTSLGRSSQLRARAPVPLQPGQMGSVGPKTPSGGRSGQPLTPGEACVSLVVDHARRKRDLSQRLNRLFN